MNSDLCFCDRLQQPTVEMQVCRSALDSIQHQLEGGNARRGFAISLKHGRRKIKRNGGHIFLAQLARAQQLLFLTAGGAGWVCFWSAATGEGAKHPLKMQNSASEGRCKENE